MKRVEIIAFDKEELLREMEEEGVEHLGQISNAAYHTVGAFAVEVILVNKSCDGVFFQEVIDRTEDIKTSEIKECEIIYADGGRPAFKLNDKWNTLRYIDNYLRIDYGRRSIK